MYSIPFSEPLGIIVGTLAGRIGAEVGKNLAREYGLPKSVCAGLGWRWRRALPGGGSYQVLLNAGMLDARGAAVSVAWTTPVIAVAHGIIEGVWEATAQPCSERRD